MTTLDDSAVGTQVGAKLEFAQSRWAHVRERNVKRVAREWTTRPHLVLALEDPRLGDAELVMLRKDLFEELVSSLASMSRVRASVQLEAKQISRVTMVLLSLVEDDPESSLALLAKTAVEMAQRLAAQLGSSAPVSELEPPELSEEENEFVRKQMRLDRGDD